MRITLIRHGKPLFELKGKARAKEIKDIISKYDMAGIVGEPSEKTKEKVQQYNVAVCSDLFRSIDSAKKLGVNEIYLKDSIFREVDLPHFNNGSLKMSINSWIALYRFMCLFGFSKNGESLSIAKKRAKIAAIKLIEIANNYESVLLVGHGFTNYFIAKELLARKWKGPQHPGRYYWEYGEYVYNAA